MKEKAIKEWREHRIAALYYNTIDGYLRHRNIDSSVYLKLYEIHNEAMATVERILSVTTVKRVLPKLEIECMFKAQGDFLNWKSKFEKQECPDLPY